MGLLGLGKIITRIGQSITNCGLNCKYGKQIGKTAKNGNRVFQKTNEFGKKVTTGIDRNGRRIKEVRDTGFERIATTFDEWGRVTHRARIKSSRDYTSVERFAIDQGSQVPTNYKAIRTYKDPITDTWSRRVLDSTKLACFLKA